MQAHGQSRINENITTIVVITIVLIPHQLFSSFGVKITIKWKIPKDKRGVAVEMIPLAVSLLEGEGKTLHFLRQTL